MSAPKANPTVRRWELAAALRALRLEVGLSIEDVAGELMCSAAKVSRLETAGRGIQPRDVRDLCRLYKVDNVERDRLMSLASEAKQQSWWHGLPMLTAGAKAYIDLEGSAAELRALEVGRLHGLLQTEVYTRCLLRRLRPPESAYEDDYIEQTVTVRKHRQSLSRASESTYSFIIDQTALSRPFGSKAEMAEQLQFLIEATSLSNYKIHVVPHSRGLYPGVDGTFTHMVFPQDSMPDVVVVDGTLGVFVLDKPSDATRYRNTFDHVVSEFALNVDDSRDWLKEYSKSHLPMSKE